KSEIYPYNKREEHGAACITLVILFKQFNFSSSLIQNIASVKRVPSPFVPYNYIEFFQVYTHLSTVLTLVHLL
ncbi:MAG: hypothetical protein OEZ21_08150, partial [Candidatus Bathyarchaeota archaeon]|nr:hypothetical protein [Candidatus Bathyarchaeota archaeon]